MGMRTMQAMCLLRLLLYMKRWKFLWSIVVFLSLVSNHVLFPMLDGWMGTMGQTYVDIGAKEFVKYNMILFDPDKDQQQLVTLTTVLNKEGASTRQIFDKCAGADCKAKLFSVLYGRLDSSMFTSYIGYGGAGNDSEPSVECQMAFGSEMNCPYLGYLAAVSQHEAEKDYNFKEIRFFSLTSRKEGKKADSERGEGTMCANHENIEAVYSRTVMFQCVLIAGTVTFYNLVSTLTCIAELKRDGFMQLMFQKGFSVLAYWLVIGGIILVEMLVFSVVYIISLTVQCPGFFNPVHTLAVFFMTLFNLLGHACLGALLTSTLRSYFYIGLMTVLTAIVSMTLIVINRMVIATIIWLKFALLFLYPLGHFGEFVQGAMLAEIRMESLGFYNIAILLVTALLLIILCGAIFLLDFTQPAGNGFLLPGNFVTCSEFWATSQPLPDDDQSDPLYGQEPEPSSNIEPVTESLRPRVRMCSISKTFESKSLCGPVSRFTAIKDMSGLLYENHITAIIGHNGAGKTTLLNLLTGAEAPTTGQVSICGVLASCPLSRRRLRGKLGICPQSISFAGSLTIEQNVRLSMASCGVAWEECREEVDDVLRMTRIDRKRSQTMGPMCTGYQRKLAIAVALLGNPQVVFLDEPTSGLDPASRRRMWKLLQKYRHGRAIIMSTQFMDEADTLADRKLFLSGGALICAGSSLFLKSTFDCGFVFQVTLKNEKHMPLLTKQICDEFKSVKARDKFGTNVNFSLPARDIDLLPNLAQALEKRMALISAFGLLQASLYDIFMRLKGLTEEAVLEIFSEERAGLVKLEESETESEANSERTTRLSDALVIGKQLSLNPSLLGQLRAMIVVNVARLVRTRFRLACRVFVPAFLLLLLLVTAILERTNENHSMHLHTNMTNTGQTFSRYGVCVSDNVTTTFAKVDAETCGFFYEGRQIRTRPTKTNFLTLHKSPAMTLAAFLQQPSVITQIEKKCRSRSANAGACPIVYTPEWTNRKNPERVIHVGSYSIYENKNSSTAASVSMGVFQKGIDFFTFSTRDRRDKFQYSAQSVYDFRSTFVPTVGAFFQILIVAFLPATFLDDIIEDKQSYVRYQLASMGMGCISYWLTNFAIHWLQYAIIYVLTTVMLQAIVQVGYTTIFFIMGVFLPTVLLGLPCNLFLVYLLSTVMERANQLVTIMYFFFSIFLAGMILVAQLNNVISVLLIALLPPYTVLALTFYGVKTVFYTLAFHKRSSLSSISSLSNTFYFTQPHVTAAFVAMILHTLLLLLALVLIENRVVLLQRFEAYVRPAATVENNMAYDDPGVQEETERVNAEPRHPDHLLEVRHLKKTYPNGNKVVRDVTFATGPKEIFGLLGPNGAGKSTTLSMLVGHLKPSGGRCEIQCGETWMPGGLAAARGAIGYCPQYDPLYDCLTVAEHLNFYATVLGVPQESIESNVSMLIGGLNLDATPGKTIGQLSVGNRRRLSLAICLLGEPAVIIIDEATTGVDPEGKRFLWKAIRATAIKNCSVLVTTHSMEEVEALCNRVIVINRGMMVGLGTVQELRTRYGHSYSLEILITTTINEDPVSIQTKKVALIIAVEKKFSGTQIIEEFNDRVHFSIPNASIGRLSQALNWLVDNKSALRINYFSFHQMSMDQVFERMVKQHEKAVRLLRRASLFSLSSEGNDAASVSQETGAV